MKTLLAKVRETDPKIVAAGVTYLLTRLITVVLGPEIGIDLSDDVVPGYLTVGQTIPLIAAAAAGWWKANAATILRTPQESGNPELPADFEAGAHTLPESHHNE